MSLFEFRTPEAREAYMKLFNKLDKSEPCFVGDADQWTENYTSRPIPNETAEELCAGCHVLEDCKIYALLNTEETGIWGGTTEQERKRLRDSE